jgi:hypothetical protein
MCRGKKKNCEADVEGQVQLFSEETLLMTETAVHYITDAV